MIKNRRSETLTKFQSRTAIYSANESIEILEQFQWNCLDAINYVLENVNSTNCKSSKIVHRIIKPSLNISESLIPNECLNELDGVRQFERAFQDRYADLNRWPTWFRGSLETAINQARGPFAIFLNHDKSIYSTTFSRQILCSSSILHMFQTYKCILWPWDVTYPLNKQHLLEKSGRARQILVKCLSYFHDINNYPLLLLLSRQKDKMLLLDVINGNWDLDQTRACLERTLNPILEQSIIPINDTTSLSPGWVGGRTAGTIHRRPSFITTFRLSRPLRTVQRPPYVSFYQQDKEVKDIIVSIEEAKKWSIKKLKGQSIHSCSEVKHQQCDQFSLSRIQAELLSPELLTSPIPSLSLSIKQECPAVVKSLRRAAWAQTVKR